MKNKFENSCNMITCCSLVIFYEFRLRVHVCKGKFLYQKEGRNSEARFHINKIIFLVLLLRISYRNT